MVRFSAPSASTPTRVAVRGVLRAERRVCTRMGCDTGCCNFCSGALELLQGGAEGVAVAVRTGDGVLGCRGDESGVCCGLPLDGGTVIARGWLGLGLAIESAELCAVAPTK